LNLTIAVAKIAFAKAVGVPPENIGITIPR
jgi:hypothetical protein